MKAFSLRGDDERGSFFIVERTQTLEVTPGFFQMHALADIFDNIDAGFNLINVTHTHHDYTTTGMGNGVFLYVRYNPILSP